jgi:hypothetical protein
MLDADPVITNSELTREVDPNDSEALAAAIISVVRKLRFAKKLGARRTCAGESEMDWRAA